MPGANRSARWVYGLDQVVTSIKISNASSAGVRVSGEPRRSAAISAPHVRQVRDRPPGLVRLALEPGEHPPLEPRGRSRRGRARWQGPRSRPGPRSSARRTRPSRSRGAASRRAAARAPRAPRTLAVTRRRLWWRALCHGSGKKTQSSSTDPAASVVSSSSAALACTSRRFGSPFWPSTDAGPLGARDRVREPGLVHLDGEVVAPGIGRGGLDDGVAQARADLHHQRGLAAEHRLGVEHELRVHGGPRDRPGHVDQVDGVALGPDPLLACR